MPSVIEAWIIAIGAMVALQLLENFGHRRGWAKLPLRLLRVAIVVWALLRSLPLQSLPATSRLWLTSLDDLLLAYASVRLLVWGALELPGTLGWWRQTPKLLLQLLTLSGWTVATVVVVRSTTRFDLVGLITTSAVLTAVIGLAAQEPLKDLLAGLELQLSDDFKPGDWLELRDGIRGVVISVSWHDTTLRNMDGALVVVPNTDVAQGVIHNLGALGPRTNRFTIGLDYDYPPGQARQLLETVVAQHPDVLKDPAPAVRVKAFDDSAITYEIHVWQKELGDIALYRLRSELLEQIWYALRREGQSIPFPIRELQRRRRTQRSVTNEGLSEQELCEALARCGVFSGLDRQQHLALLSDSKVMAFGAGEAIVEEGAEGQSLYLLLRGEVSVQKGVAPDRSVTVSRLGPGDVIGEMTLFLDTPRSATVRAEGECLLLKVQRDCVRSLLESNPGLLERFASIVGARQAELEHLGKDQQQEQKNALLESMKMLFFALKGR